MIEKIRGTSYVIFHGEQNIPIASAVLAEDGTIRSIWVDKDFRRRGYAEVLIKEIIEDSGSIFREVALLTSPDNKPMNSLARKVGMKFWHRWYLRRGDEG